MNRTTHQALHKTEAYKRHHQIRLIVSYLMQALHIPDGDHLTHIFGIGHERSNRQALTHWVETHLDEINPDETEHRLRKLADQTNNGIED